MIEWMNVSVMIVSSYLILHFYRKSASPAALEKKIGPDAYPKCKQYRIIASAFMVVVTLNYILYFFFPLPIGLPLTFPWDYWITVTIAFVICVPGFTLQLIGTRDAGEETIAPKKEHTMYGGIYEKMRHPQAVGEVTLWWLIAFLLNSPFLALYSFVFIPIFYLMCLAEERDLIIRYGQDYVDYKARVGFFPQLRKK